MDRCRQVTIAAFGQQTSVFRPHFLSAVGPASILHRQLHLSQLGKSLRRSLTTEQGQTEYAYIVLGRVAV